MSQMRFKIMDTPVSEAADDFIEAKKAYNDAKDRLQCTIKHLASLMREKGLRDKQVLEHEEGDIILKDEVLKEASVTLKKRKENAK